MFEALGRVMYRRRRWVVALAAAFVVFAGVWGTGVYTDDSAICPAACMPWLIMLKVPPRSDPMAVVASTR